ncbi:MAG: M48 family metallopeptidase [Candidatus Anammoxibacter sp.]
MTIKTLHFPDIGDVLLRKSNKAKHLNITIGPFEPPNVAVPRSLSFDDAEEFVIDKLSWLRKKTIDMKVVEDRHTHFTENTIYKTKEHHLVIKRNGNNLHARINSSTININIPSESDINDKMVQQLIRNAIERTLRKEANNYLPGQVRKLAEVHRFKFGNVSIRNTRTRWGSCSHNDNLNFSLHVMRLPYHLIDYIILHELAHTTRKNHKKLFWKKLEKVCPKTKEHEKELKAYSIQVW